MEAKPGWLSRLLCAEQFAFCRFETSPEFTVEGPRICRLPRYIQFVELDVKSARKYQTLIKQEIINNYGINALCQDQRISKENR